MNKVILVGNLTRDPELSETPSGITVCKFSIAVSRDYTNADGERETDFFNIVAWRGRAETCGKYLKKGNKVAVVGKIETRSYEDKDGIKRNVFDVVAEQVEFLTPKSDSKPSEQADGETVFMKKTRTTPPQLEEIDDDNQLPF